MKKCKQIMFVAVLAFCLSMVAKAESKAAAVTGVKQIDDSSSSLRVQCNAQLGAQYYYLELSEDKVTWYVRDVSSNANSLSSSGLGAGKTYYARVGICTDYDYTYSTDTYVIIGASSVSAPIDVVTAPSGSVDAVQKSAKTNGFSMQVTGAIGANYYTMTCNNAVIGQGASSVVSTNRTLAAATAYWVTARACRRSSTGYVAEGNSDYVYVKTLSPAINTKNFGVTSSFVSINVFYFGISNNNYSTDGWQWQFTTPSGKSKKVITGDSSPRIADFIEGNFYKYRVRSYVNCGSTKAYSAWSPFKTIALPKKVSAKWKSKSRSLKINWSKISNATGYTVYISTKEHSGFKKVKSLKAKTRSVTIKKCGKKRLKKNVTYYVRIVPKAKIGKKATSATSYGVYSFKAY